MAAAVLVADRETLRAATTRLAKAQRIALDLESNGLFRYRASLCTLQLLATDAAEEPVYVVDTIAIPAADLSAELGPLLAAGGPRKIIHDVSFDARILAETGMIIGNVLDTSLAARMLGRTATGLASLLGAELGIQVDKKLQHHDWTERPLRAQHLRYLADDVIHLEGLAQKLWSEVEARGIEAEIEEETGYRLRQAAHAAVTADPRPPWVRLKGIDKTSYDEQKILRRLADLRERKAAALDVPPYKVVGPDVLFAIAKARPRSMAELDKVKGATSGGRARSLAAAFLAAVVAAEEIPADERAMIERPRIPPAVVKARRAREGRLIAWRRAEAKRREVDEQVVLPGHVLQDLADLEDGADLAAIAAVPGLGAFRAARDGEALRAILKPTEEP